jgi:dihydropteroate synthase
VFYDQTHQACSIDYEGGSQHLGRQGRPGQLEQGNRHADDCNTPVGVGSEACSQRCREPRRADREAEELRRLIPVLKRLRGRLTIPISVDTYKSGVAEKAIEYGAEIINDPTGILLDLQLPRIVTKHDAGLVINHMRGTPETWAKLPPLRDPMRSISIDLEAAIHRARQAGVQKHQIVIDPGLGFGKRREQNSEIIANLGMLESFDLPILVGPSRKSFLKREQETDTEFATAGAVAASILNGAHLVRVHDVKAMRVVAEVVDAIRQASQPEAEAVPTQARWQRGQ